MTHGACGSGGNGGHGSGDKCCRDAIDLLMDYLERRLPPAEQAALECLDVLHFSVAADAIDITLPTGNTAAGCFAVSAWAHQRRRSAGCVGHGDQHGTGCWRRSRAALPKVP